MPGQLANVDPKIAQCVAKGLGHQAAIHPVETTVAARTDLKHSPALSILAKAKPTLEAGIRNIPGEPVRPGDLAGFCGSVTTN
jgi:hypothetical protein